jgi:hypothetical protein
MKQLLLISLLFSYNAFAYDNSPYALFSTDKNIVTQSTVKWIPVDNVQEVCERESRRRGNNGFGYTLNACTFWDVTGPGTNTCTIITNKNPMMNTIGHEIRHCFQGNWHNE